MQHNGLHVAAVGMTRQCEKKLVFQFEIGCDTAERSLVAVEVVGSARLFQNVTKIYCPSGSGRITTFFQNQTHFQLQRNTTLFKHWTLVQPQYIHRNPVSVWTKSAS
jgi:hypothetical protein